MIRLQMKNYNRILIENQQKHQHYHLAKIDKYDHLTDEDVLSSNQSHMIEQAKIAYSPPGKAFEK